MRVGCLPYTLCVSCPASGWTVVNHNFVVITLKMRRYCPDVINVIDAAMFAFPSPTCVFCLYLYWVRSSVCGLWFVVWGFGFVIQIEKMRNTSNTNDPPPCNSSPSPQCMYPKFSKFATGTGSPSAM